MIGIYIIKCFANNKVYIGQSINLEKRVREHKNKLIRNAHPNLHLQKAFNKYGKEQFSFEYLYILPVEEYTKEKLDALEIQYISLFNSNNRDNGYNIESGGNGNGRASAETRDKLSRAMKGKYVGRKLSEKTKALMSEHSARYWLGKHHSVKTRMLFSEQRKGKPSHWRGKTQSDEHIQNRIKTQYGKVWVYKDKDSRFVTQEVAEQLVKEGFSFGRPFQKRVKGKKYYYNGALYTLPQIAEMCHISKTILFARMRNGWSLDEATITPPIPKDDKKGKHLYNGEYLNLTYISKLVGIEYEVLRSRLRRGLSLDEAIKKPIRKRNK